MPADQIDAQAAFADVADALDAIVAVEQAKNNDLYKQRDALKQQIRDLNVQLNELNRQIDDGESDDLRKARALKTFKDALDSGRGALLRQPML